MPARSVPRQVCSSFAILICLLVVAPVRAEHEGKVQVLLLGDSTTIGSVCRRAEPKGPHLEDVVRNIVSTEADLPPLNVINQGRDGEYIHGLLSTGRYDRDVAKLPGIDYVFIRYGLNDLRKRENFDENFPKDYHDLIARLKTDHPQAVIIPTTTIPYLGQESDDKLLATVRQVGRSEGLPVFDVFTRYAEELKKGPNMLNYRRFFLKNIPAEHHAWLKPYASGDSVVVMDNRFDAHFGHLDNWYGDRHPNLAGYAVIGDETAKFLGKLLRERK